MRKGHAVIDGSNIATEGRSEPSLAQLREAVAEFTAENDFKYITVVVDASFEHRVASREKKAARAAIDAGEMITPPAGVIGRGDTFILEVADRADAIVLSNDSFQEFHGIYDWLFTGGRLIGGKPIPGVGWVYVPRTPVRGPVSRRATKETKTTKKAAAPARKKASATTSPSRSRSRGTRTREPRPAIGATKKAPKSSAAPASSPQPSDGANTVKVWREFTHDYPVGGTVAATVDEFSSHGAYGSVGDAIVYLPNRLLGDPAPTRARDVLSLGETRDFLVHRFDEERRGIDLGLVPVDASATPAKARSARKRGAKASDASTKKTAAKRTARKTTARKTTAEKATAKKTAAKRTTAKQTAAKKTTARKTAAKKSAAKKTTAKRTTAKKTTARKTAAKKTAAETTTAKKTAGTGRTSSRKRSSSRRR